MSSSSLRNRIEFTFFILVVQNTEARTCKAKCLLFFTSYDFHSLNSFHIIIKQECPASMSHFPCAFCPTGFHISFESLVVEFDLLSILSEENSLFTTGSNGMADIIPSPATTVSKNFWPFPLPFISHIATKVIFRKQKSHQVIHVLKSLGWHYTLSRINPTSLKWHALFFLVWPCLTWNVERGPSGVIKIGIIFISTLRVPRPKILVMREIGHCQSRVHALFCRVKAQACKRLCLK